LPHLLHHRQLNILLLLAAVVVELLAVLVLVVYLVRHRMLLVVGLIQLRLAVVAHQSREVLQTEVMETTQFGTLVVQTAVRLLLRLVVVVVDQTKLLVLAIMEMLAVRVVVVHLVQVEHRLVVLEL
jgi:hypothetical protein